ncbi:MAG: ankyrin repeat domain-containing protein [Phycisphaerae bacterium]|nr:ankyrin repeat domain-containing protein [Phycisphaerae bacterium]
MNDRFPLTTIIFILALAANLCLAQPASASGNEQYQRGCELHDAVSARDIAAVTRLLDEGIPVDVPGQTQMTALHVAAARNWSEGAKILLERGADPNAKDRYGWTPLHFAAANGFSNIAETLLNHKASADARDSRSGLTPLHRAGLNGHDDIVAMLLKRGVQADIPTTGWYSGMTPLHWSAAGETEGNARAVKLLLKAGADAKRADRPGMTALHWAILARNETSVKLLLAAGAKINAANDQGVTPRSLASQSTDRIRNLVLGKGKSQPHEEKSVPVTPVKREVRKSPRRKTPARRVAHYPPLSVEAITDELIYKVDPTQPVTLLLSKSIYPIEDRHLDAIVWLSNPKTNRIRGHLSLILRDKSGKVLTRKKIGPIPGERLFLSLALPEELTGSGGEFEVIWQKGAGVRCSAKQAFTVSPPTGVNREGRIRITIPNNRGASGVSVPVTVGVPFPRGALDSPDHVRLVDATGKPTPVQTKVTARWSRFGSVKWLQCDFTARMNGKGREFFLQFGPDVKRRELPPMSVQPREGLPPLVDTGPLQFGDGIQYDPGDGKGFRTVVTPAGLEGGFVEHENGGIHVQPRSVKWQVEDAGPRKVVLRREGWYVDAKTKRKFCRFNTRFVLQKDSSLVKIFHTWIYTGDAYKDRIRNMGWKFDLANAEANKFLTENDRWISGDWLLQYDYDRYKIVANGALKHCGRRSPGIADVSTSGVRMLLGVNDFRQNYPNELEFRDGALFVHQWPRHGRPAVHPVRIEDALRLWFAHEGKRLNFALPLDWTEDPDFYYAPDVTHPRNREAYQMRHRRETINAQGISKTDEIRLLFAPEKTDPTALAATLEGLDDATLRASVDPKWVAGSGAFYEIHPRDVKNFPEEERYYEQAALAPLRWVERIQFYGKWIWGDMAWAPDLDKGGHRMIYRGFRKAHQAWPYSWIPYARSGDPRFLHFADAATRHVVDTAFCHYSDRRVPGLNPRPGLGRPRGFHIRYRIPWAGHGVNPSSRGYVDKADYMLHSYYLTGYERARDVLLDWAELTKYVGWNNWGGEFEDRTNFQAPMKDVDAWRGSVNLLKAYVEMYEASYDPWFLAAAHQIARAHLQEYRAQNQGDRDALVGFFWQPGQREFLRFSGDEDYRKFYLAYARRWAAREIPAAGWIARVSMMEAAAFGWVASGDEYYLRRARGMLTQNIDWAYDEQTGCKSGIRAMFDPYADAHHMGYLLQYYPNALHAAASAKTPPLPLNDGFFQLPAEFTADKDETCRYGYRVALKKSPDKPLGYQIRFQRAGRGFRYRLFDPAGKRITAGCVDSSVPKYGEIPAKAPAGVYRLVVEGASATRPGPGQVIDGLYFPVSTTTDPEVWELGDDRQSGVTSHRHGANYWFMVPEGVKEFHLEFLNARKIPKITIRDPDGKNVRQYQRPVQKKNVAKNLLVNIRVPEGQSGKLWQIAVANESLGIRFDKRIPPYLSTEPAGWFDPGPAPESHKNSHNKTRQPPRKQK